jgi:hypothetical protein
VSIQNIWIVAAFIATLFQLKTIVHTRCLSKMSAAFLLLVFLWIPMASVFHAHHSEKQHVSLIKDHTNVKAHASLQAKCLVCDYILQKQSQNFLSSQLYFYLVPNTPVSKILPSGNWDTLDALVLLQANKGPPVLA